MLILYTGTNPKKYQHLGTVIHLPMIEISKVDLSSVQIKKCIDKLSEYSMILLTSRFGVQYFFQFFQEKKYSLEELKNKDFITIGETTTEALKKYNIYPVLEADVETSQGLFTEIQNKLHVKEKNILFPRSALSNPYLKEHLIKAGAHVDELVVYQNTKPEKRPLPKENIETVIFTSPSTVKNFLADYKTIPLQWKILSKGSVTSKALKEAGYIGEIL